MKLRQYYHVTKPGIVYGNVFHLVAGAFLATPMRWSWVAFLGAIAGSALVIASACVVNNILDRSVDRTMQRTKQRELVTGDISLPHAWLYSACLASSGFLVLLLCTNTLTAVLGAVAYISYAGVYTYSKQKTNWSTIIGTLPGALPGVAGYTAMTGAIDEIALAFGIVLLIWQLPHFYAISLMRRNDYQRSAFHVVTNHMSERHAQYLIAGLVGVHTVVILWLCAVGLRSIAGGILLAAALWWLVITVRLSRPSKRWARRVFSGSLILTMLFPITALIHFVVTKNM